MLNRSNGGMTVLHRFLGTRRAAMLIIGLSAIFRGFTLLHDSERQFAAQSILFVDLPIEWRIAGWAGGGIIAVGAAFFAKPHNEWIGWFALALMPVERIFGYVWSFTAFLLPGGPGGSPYAILYALQWLCALGLLAVISSWREDSPSRLWLNRNDKAHE